MNPESDRLREHLDGETADAPLMPDEQRDAERFLAAFAPLRADAPLAGPLFTARVMAAVEAEVRPRRSIRLHPLAAAAAALALVAGGAGLARWLDGDRQAAAPPANVVRFVLVDRSAQALTVTGDFVGWSVTGVPMRDERGDGVWIAEVPLAPGVHQYVFIVDGREWRPDPAAPLTADDGFGRRNSVIVVPDVQS